MSIELFNLIKNHEYQKLISKIKFDDKIDLNETDESGTFLIQYAIMFRQKDLVALLISKGCKLDILDSDGHGIFYLPIKFGYDDIVRLLINFSNVVIGMPLLEMQDLNGNIPLHYAITYKKYDIIEEMLKTKSNINFKDLNGNTILHIIVKSMKTQMDNNLINIFNMIIDGKIGLNHMNNLGQNVLHIAVENNNLEICKTLIKHNIAIDIQTIDDHLTPLILSTIQNNFEICKLLLANGANINNQDIYGDSVLNHAIINKSIKLIKLFANFPDIDVNLINADGNTALILYFMTEYNYDKLEDYEFSKILTMSDINIQNNVGQTIWHYLAENNIWESYLDILMHKTNKIFIQNNNEITPYDIIVDKFPNKLNTFMIVIANSYYNLIKKDLESNDESVYVENSIYEKIKQTLVDLSNDKSNDKSNNKSKIYPDEQILTDIISHILESRMSVPELKKLHILNELNYSNVKFSSYTGISLDIISGLLYITKKFPNVSTSLTKNFILNEKLENYYKSNGINKEMFSDFLNFELIWSFHKLFIPTIFKQQITNFFADDTKRYLVFPLGIELSNGAHANILLYDKETSHIERFEPYGKSFPPGFNYNPTSLDTHLKNLFLNYLNANGNMIYYDPSMYETKIGLQLLDTIEYAKQKNIGDPGGFCAAWALWYIEMRIINNQISKNLLIDKLINYIRLKRVSFRSIIRSFTKNITDIRDKLLTNANLDINIWLNNNYTEIEWNKLVELIKQEI